MPNPNPSTDTFNSTKNRVLLLRALRFAKRYRRLLVLYSLAIALSGMAAMGPPLLIRELIDDAIPHADKGFIAELLAGIAGFYLLSALFLVIGGYLGTIPGTRIML